MGTVPLDELQLHRTSDLGLATALLACDFDIKGLDAANPRRVFVYFIRTDALESAVDDYWGGRMRVCPKAYSNYRKEVLTRIREDTSTQKRRSDQRNDHFPRP